MDVTLAGVGGSGAVKCSRNVSIVPDAALEDALKKGPYDALVMPGGGGGAKILAQVSVPLSVAVELLWHLWCLSKV